MVFLCLGILAEKGLSHRGAFLALSKSKTSNNAHFAKCQD